MKTKEVTGNLVSLAQEGQFDMIAHGCNCFHNMGGGIAKAISETWPEALEVDKLHAGKGDGTFLGLISFAHVMTDADTKMDIANLYTQFQAGGAKDHPDVDSVENRKNYFTSCFGALGRFLLESWKLAEILKIDKDTPDWVKPKDFPPISPEGFRVGIPLIGAGIAGGNWEELAPIAIEALEKVPGELTIVHFDQPAASTTLGASPEA